MSLLIASCLALLGATENLTVADFTFEGPLGSAGATIEAVDTNHFKVTLGHAPAQPTWSNKLQFTILRHAKGNGLKLDVSFPVGGQYEFNEYFYSYSYDGDSWHPVQWEKGRKVSKTGDTLTFPAFTEDKVYVGHQVPFSYEDFLRHKAVWEKHPDVTAIKLGTSLGGRDLWRMEITGASSAVPRPKRWVHHISNQHPGEFNSHWRIVGLVEWLLSDAGKACRDRMIFHVVPFLSPDAPSQGWYRVNAQGIDMNRSYFVGGSDSETQAHEPFIVQKDLESLMASESPVNSIWSMHTWGGNVEPLVRPGPEFAGAVGKVEDFEAILDKLDPKGLVIPLKARTNEANGTYWSGGPHRQFGITGILCEGAGAIYNKADNIESGRILAQGLAEFYRGTRP
jgi:hypothetical protein